MFTMVYFVQIDCPGEQPIRIGYSSDPRTRIRNIKAELPWDIKVLAVISGELAAERSIHARFSEVRMSGEWFAPHPDILDFIADCHAETIRRKLDIAARKAASARYKACKAAKAMLG